MHKIKTDSNKKEISEHLLAFNNHVDGFMKDLERIFGDSDTELILCKGFLSFRCMKADFVMNGFKKYFLCNKDLCMNILTENVDYFIETDFMNLVDETDPAAELTKTLLQKIKGALVKHRDDTSTLKTVFHWMKLLLVSSASEQGKTLEEILSEA